MTPTSVAQPELPPITLRSPADLVAATPYLLGFHPTGSLVVLGFDDRRLVFAVRGGLSEAGDPPELVASDALRAAERPEVSAVAILGYGPAGEVDPMVHALHRSAAERGLFVKDALRVDSGRWWSYVCEDPRCCPPEGTPIDHATSEVSARCAYEGLAAAPSRDHVARLVAPVGGPARSAMTQATDRAEQRFRDRLASVPEGEQVAAVQAAGTAAVNAAIERYAGGGPLDDDELAWLSILLVSIPVRDAAWWSITNVELHLRLWGDATRRVDPALVAAPATLLGFTAWRAGDGVLAGLALDRALHEDPSYSLAHTILGCVQQGPPPDLLDVWGTPAWAERAERAERAEHERDPRRHRPKPGPRRRGSKSRHRKPRRASRRRS
jgi:hypothetical protein